MGKLIKQSVEDWIDSVKYGDDENYVPSEFALEFVNFIKLVNGSDGEENSTPVIHYKMLDNIHGKKQLIANMLFRGSGKTTVLCEYMFLYVAVFGSIPGFGMVTSAIYVAHSVDKGVKDLRRNIEARYNRSEFLRKYVPVTKFTDTRLYFKNKFGKEFLVNGFGILTGVRGKKESGFRPELAFIDDVLSDSDARSQTVIDAVIDVVYKAVNHAMHPKRKKIVWTGTPFNARDPLYRAIESGAWHVSVFPVCEEFPCKREDFKGAWEDRFDYDYVKEQHSLAIKSGMAGAFNQELMLRIMNEEERIIDDSDIQWYKHRNVLKNRGAYNFYITTDFATSEEQHADFSVINVWALNNIGDWFWVDGIYKQMLMDETMNHLFRLAQKWQPQAVGVEVTGQQGGFIQWIKQLMGDRNIYFPLACPIGSNKPGLRPVKDKMSRFQTVAVPLFKAGKMNFPEELDESSELAEILIELRLATVKGFKSKHNDEIDTITMLGEIETWRPSEDVPGSDEEGESISHEGIYGIMDDDEEGGGGESSYFV